MPSLPTSEQSLWRTFYQKPLYPRLSEDLQADVVVIGAGITGLTCAYLLKQAGFSVVVLEKDTVGGGTTGRTTGKVTSQHGITYADLQQRQGIETARAYGRMNQAALEQVAAIVKAERLECDWQRDDNYVYTTDATKVAQFRQEATVAANLGLPATFETTSPLPFAIQGAVKFANQGKINAQKYVLGLAHAIQGDGCVIFEQSTVIGIRDGEPCRVRTSGGSVQCKDVVVATNVPTLPLMARGGYCILEYPTESFIVSGQPQQQLHGMYISPDKGQYSILPITVEGTSQLLIGGEGGHLPGMRLSKTKRFKKLAVYAHKHFGIDTITHTWSDRDYLAYDNIPLIGKLYPWSKHLYVGTAYRKWGLSNGTAAGIVLCDLITGKTNPWAAHVTPARLSPVTSIPRAVVQYLKG